MPLQPAGVPLHEPTRAVTPAAAAPLPGGALLWRWPRAARQAAGVRGTGLPAQRCVIGGTSRLQETRLVHTQRQLPHMLLARGGSRSRPCDYFTETQHAHCTHLLLLHATFLHFARAARPARCAV